MNYIISFPRSGQHLIESVLIYLSNRFDLNFSYCEYYNCCNNILCSNGFLFQKNHDFWIDPRRLDYNLNALEIKKSNKYLVLYRKDMIKQLESYYRYYLKYEEKEYNYNELISFIESNIGYYNNFVNKWVEQEDDKILIIEYYKFLEDPNFYSKNIVKHFFEKDLDFDITNLDFGVKSGINKSGQGFIISKIKLRNEIDQNLYNKIKSDLKL